MNSKLSKFKKTAKGAGKLAAFFAVAGMMAFAPLMSLKITTTVAAEEERVVRVLPGTYRTRMERMLDRGDTLEILCERGINVIMTVRPDDDRSVLDNLWPTLRETRRETVKCSRHTSYHGEVGPEVKDEMLTLLQYTYMTFDETNREIAVLANEITRGITNDLERTKAIHTWVAENIWYDFDSFYGRRSGEGSEPLHVLESKTAICDGYARLTVDMLNAVGILAVHVGGFTGVGVHAWVEAYVDGRWISLDPTWDSGNRFEHGRFSEQQPSRDRWFDFSPGDSHRAAVYSNVSFRHANTVEFEYGLRYIPERAFAGSNMTNVVIPDSVTRIGDEAFFLSNLISVVLPTGLIEINEGAFVESNLTEVTLPNGLQHIGRSAFLDTKLTTVVIPESVISIGAGAFQIEHLRNVVILSSDTVIGHNYWAGSPFFPQPGLTIYGHPGSTAEAHARSNDINFRPLSEWVNVTINGAVQSFEVPPQIIGGRTMLPLRAIGEVLGMEVIWNGATQTATLTASGVEVVHVIHSSEVTVNGVAQSFDASSTIIDGRTLVPVRMLAEAIGAEVVWNAETRTVAITTL